MNNETILKQLCERYPLLFSLKGEISGAAEMIISCYSGNGKLLVCGNGGSSADSDHIVGEMMKSFEAKRSLDKDISEKLKGISAERGSYLSEKLEVGLPAISLSAHTALATAICNDIGSDLVFAQQVLGYGRKNDVLVAISSSGNSQNVTDACITARAMNIKVIGLTGDTGGRMKPFCDILINVPEKRTAYVQELHLPVIHALCLLVENHFFGKIKY